MKKYLKLVIGTSLALFAGSANANVYKITLEYGSDLGGENAGLSGFFFIDTSLDTSNELTTRNQAGYSDGSGGLPDWITFASMTYDPTPLNVNSGDEITKTTNTFQLVKWDLTTDGQFNVRNNFVGQLDGFGFVSTFADGSFNLGNGTLEQNYTGINPALDPPDNSNSEFLLSQTTTTPGELPILGLGALIYYYKKFKNKKLSS